MVVLDTEVDLVDDLLVLSEGSEERVKLDVLVAEKVREELDECVEVREDDEDRVGDPDPVVDRDNDAERVDDRVAVIVFVPTGELLIFAEDDVDLDTDVEGVLLRVKLVVFDAVTEEVVVFDTEPVLDVDRVAVVVLLLTDEPVGFFDKLGVLELDDDIVLVLVSDLVFVPNAVLLDVCVPVMVLVVVEVNDVLRVPVLDRDEEVVIVPVLELVVVLEVVLDPVDVFEAEEDGVVDRVEKTLLDGLVETEFDPVLVADLEELVLPVELRVALVVLEEDADLEDVGHADGLLEVLVDPVDERDDDTDLVPIDDTLEERDDVVVLLTEDERVLILDAEVVFVENVEADGVFVDIGDLVGVIDWRGVGVGTELLVEVRVDVGVIVSNTATSASFRFSTSRVFPFERRVKKKKIAEILLIILYNRFPYLV